MCYTSLITLFFNNTIFIEHYSLKCPDYYLSVFILLVSHFLVSDRIDSDRAVL